MAKGGTGVPADGAASQRLERNLRDQVAAQEDLLAALETQRTSMGQLAGDRLRATLDDAGALVQRIAGLVGERRRLLQAMAGRPRAPGGPAEPLDAAAWEHVLARAPTDLRDRLGVLRRRARDLAERIGRANGVNRRVTERALVHFGSLLATMAGGGHATYAPRGGGRVGVRAAGKSTLVDRVA